MRICPDCGKIEMNDIVAVVSPPFASTDCARHDDPESYKKYGDNIYRPNQMPMPDNPDNIANLPYKQMVGVVSPPYQDAIVNFENDAGKKRVERLRQAGFDRKNSGMIRSIETKSEVNAYKGFSEGYSQNPENIGNLKDKGSIVGITSPPYVAQSGGHNVKGGHIDEGLLKRSSAGRVGDDRYTQTEGNIANLKDTAFVGITSKFNRNIYIPINIILPLCQIKNITNVQIAENYAGQKDAEIVGKEIQIDLKELKNIIEKYLKLIKENQNLGYKVQSIIIGKGEIQDGVEEDGNQSTNRLNNEMIIPAKNAGEQETRLRYVFTISKDGKMGEQQFLKILLQSANLAIIKNINLVIKDLFITARYAEGNIILVQLCRESVKNQNAEQHTTQQNITDGSQRNEQPNYLSEMLRVYKEASKVCPIICVVTKNPTRAGKLRRLDIDTAMLLEKSGYQIVDYHRAVLFKTYEQSTLTGETKKEHKGRLSFFKRLSLSKGNQAAMWEDVLIGVKNG